MRVTSAAFIKNYGALSDTALKEAVTITRNGRDRLVLVSVEEYERLKRRDRRVVKLEDFTDEEMELIANSQMPPGLEYLDEELKGWNP